MSDLTEMNALKAPSSSEEGVGGGASQRKTLLRRAAIMRSNLTEPERRLWMALRDKRFKGYKFRRQAIIGDRIMDFFCPAKGLVVELDGVAAMVPHQPANGPHHIFRGVREPSPRVQVHDRAEVAQERTSHA